MAFINVVCVFVVVLSVVDGRSVLEPNQDTDLSVDTLHRVKRSIMNGSADNGCAKGAFRFGTSCVSCEEFGRKRNKRTKVCHGKCVSIRHLCPKGNRRKIYT